MENKIPESSHPSESNKYCENHWQSLSLIPSSAGPQLSIILFRAVDLQASPWLITDVHWDATWYNLGFLFDLFKNKKLHVKTNTKEHC